MSSGPDPKSVMRDDQSVLLVCMRIADGPAILGSTARCKFCNAVVEISPATSAYYASLPEAQKEYICTTCFMPLYAEALANNERLEIAMPSQAQIDEVAEVMAQRRREESNKPKQGGELMGEVVKIKIVPIEEQRDGYLFEECKGLDPAPLALKTIAVVQRATEGNKSGVLLLMEDINGTVYSAKMTAAMYLTIGGAVKGAMQRFNDGEHPEGYA